jgi:hypothetical protein
MNEALKTMYLLHLAGYFFFLVAFPNYPVNVITISLILAHTSL